MNKIINRLAIVMCGISGILWAREQENQMVSAEEMRVQMSTPGTMARELTKFQLLGNFGSDSALIGALAGQRKRPNSVLREVSEYDDCIIAAARFFLSERRNRNPVFVTCSQREEVESDKKRSRSALGLMSESGSFFEGELLSRCYSPSAVYELAGVIKQSVVCLLLQGVSGTLAAVEEENSASEDSDASSKSSESNRSFVVISPSRID